MCTERKTRANKRETFIANGNKNWIKRVVAIIELCLQQTQVNKMHKNFIYWLLNFTPSDKNDEHTAPHLGQMMEITRRFCQVFGNLKEAFFTFFLSFILDRKAIEYLMPWIFSIWKSSITSQLEYFFCRLYFFFRTFIVCWMSFVLYLSNKC